jgi:hypothetical protein
MRVGFPLEGQSEVGRQQGNILVEIVRSVFGVSFGDPESALNPACRFVAYEFRGALFGY